MSNHVVIFDAAAQTLRHTAPEVIVSATFEIVDLTLAQDNADRILGSGAADVPTYTLTLDLAAGPNQPDAKLVPVDVTAGPAVGDTVVVTASDGSFEAFTIQAIELDDYVSSSSFLAGTYAIGSTVEGVTITAPVAAALYSFEDALDDQRPLAVIWTYTVAAGVRVVSEPIQLSRGNVSTASIGEALDVVRLGYPEISGRLLAGLTLEGLAEYCWKRVRADLMSRSTDPTKLLLGETGTMLLAAKIVAEAATRGYAPGMVQLTDFITDSADDYGVQLERLTTGTPGDDAILVDTEHTALTRPDQTYRAPISAA